MTPFISVFQYRRFFASPEGGGIGGGGGGATVFVWMFNMLASNVIGSLVNDVA